MTAAHNQHITTHHTVQAQVGRNYFFEFTLSNQYLSDQTFEVRFQDPELRLVTDMQEWRLLKTLNGIGAGSLEKDFINLRGQSECYEIWLRGGESVSIPFVYQSWRFPGSNSAECKDIQVRCIMFLFQL